MNSHLASLNNTVHALEALSGVVQEDITYVRVVRDLMQDVIGETSSLVSSLKAGPTMSPLTLLSKFSEVLLPQWQHNSNFGKIIEPVNTIWHELADHW